MVLPSSKTWDFGIWGKSTHARWRHAMLPCQGVVAERTVRYALLGLLPFPAQPRKSASDYGPVWLDNQDRPPVPAGEAHGRV